MPEKTAFQAELLQNRIAKKYRLLRKWARKNLVSCYRLYDRDIPEIPLAVDLYEFLPGEIRSPEEAQAFMAEEAAQESANIPGAAQKRLERTYLKAFLFERPYEKPEDKEKEWLSAMGAALSRTLGVDQSRIVFRTRERSKGGSQYAKDEAAKGADGRRKKKAAQGQRARIFGADEASARNAEPSEGQGAFKGRVFENGSIFWVDLKSYLDTGLFLDMRAARALIKENSRNKRVLNLFCYTSSFSVAAAAGGAAFVRGADLSNTYLAWSKENFLANNIGEASFALEKADVLPFLESCKEKFDIIILDPPTFSASKSAKKDFDIQRDWAALANLCLGRLADGGALYFSTNSRRFKLDPSLLNGATADDITERTIDEDFKQKKSHKMWLIQKA